MLRRRSLVSAAATAAATFAVLTVAQVDLRPSLQAAESPLGQQYLDPSAYPTAAPPTVRFVRPLPAPKVPVQQSQHYNSHEPPPLVPGYQPPGFIPVRTTSELRPVVVHDPAVGFIPTETVEMTQWGGEYGEVSVSGDLTPHGISPKTGHFKGAVTTGDRMTHALRKCRDALGRATDGLRRTRIRFGREMQDSPQHFALRPIDHGPIAQLPGTTESIIQATHRVTTCEVAPLPPRSVCTLRSTAADRSVELERVSPAPRFANRPVEDRVPHQPLPELESLLGP